MLHTWKKLFVLLFLFAQIIPFQEASASLPKQAYIKGVVGHKQSYSLSCESRSAVDWAAYWGKKISEKKFLLKLPRSDNPDLGFVGSPDDPWGNIPPASYGVHAKPVADLLKQYGFETESQNHFTWQELQAEIASGRPVIVWVIGQMWSGKPVKIKLKSGKFVTVAKNEHTMIVIGYDSKLVYVVDAYSGKTQAYSKSVFFKSWSVLGNMAITGQPLKKGESQNNLQGPPLSSEKGVFLPLVMASD